MHATWSDYSNDISPRKLFWSSSLYFTYVCVISFLFVFFIFYFDFELDFFVMFNLLYHRIHL